MAREGEGMPRIVRRIMDCPRMGEADAENQEQPEKRAKDGDGATPRQAGGGLSGDKVPVRSFGH